jgi:DNA/RNA-binding domain of Phe-tRNA-synthetase-like protein
VSAAGDARSTSLTLEPALCGRVRVGTLAAGPVAVAPTEPALAAEIEQTAAQMRERYGSCAPAAIEELGPARELYRTFGIDPTKTRPSSEKLLRRVLRGAALPRISNAVDLGNLLALRFLLPIGLFDASKIDGDVVLRPGAPDESYEGIASQVVHLAGRPVLADRRGPFGNPTADSRRTSVDPSTSVVWMTVFAPASFSATRLEDEMRFAAEAFTRHLAGAGVAVRTLLGQVD